MFKKTIINPSENVLLQKIEINMHKCNSDSTVEKQNAFKTLKGLIEYQGPESFKDLAVSKDSAH